MKKSVSLAVAISILGIPTVRGQNLGWQKIDTVTSGNYVDHNPQLDHWAGQLPQTFTDSVDPANEWMVFERDSAGISSVAGERFWLTSWKWDSSVTEISQPIPGVVQLSPDVCSMIYPYPYRSVLAAWLQQENGVKSIRYSTFRQEQGVWASPQTMIADTIYDDQLKVRSYGSSLLVTWRRGGAVMYSLFNPDSTTSPDTLVVSNFDSVEYDLDSYNMVWTYRDSGSGRIGMYGGQVTLGLPNKVTAFDTVLSDGDIREPLLSGSGGFWPTFEVVKSDRVEGHTVTLTSYPSHAIDCPLISKEGTEISNFAFFGADWSPTYWLWEEKSLLDTSVVFVSQGDTEIVKAGENPLMGSIVQFLYDFPLNTFSNVAVWNGTIDSKAHILGRPFLPYIGDAVKENQSPDRLFYLGQNYPNPFNPVTVIRIEVPKAEYVSLIVYDILGKRVKTLVNGGLTPGYYEVPFDGSKLASGVYFYRFSAGSFKQVKKMVLLK